MEKTNFSFLSGDQVEQSSRWLQLWLVSTSPLSTGTPSGADPCRPFALLPQSLWVHMCTSHVYRGSCFLGLFHPIGSYNLSTSFSGVFSEPRRKGFDGEVSLRTGCYKVSIAQLWVSVFVSSTVGENFSDDGWAGY